MTKLAYGWHPSADDTITANRGLMERIISSRRRPDHIDPDDLRQEARIGLLLAWKKHDPARGAFSTVAALWMGQRIDRFIDTNLTPIHIPVPIVHRQRKLFRGTITTKDMHDRDRAAEQVLGGRIDIDSARPDGYPLHTTLRDEHAACPLAGAELISLAGRVGELLDRLPPRMARIVRLRYGIGCHPHSAREVGELIGVAKQRVDQIRQDAERRMARMILDRDLKEQLLA